MVLSAAAYFAFAAAAFAFRISTDSGTAPFGVSVSSENPHPLHLCDIADELYEYKKLTGFLCLLVALSTGIFGVWFLGSRSAENRTLSIFNSLPGRVGVCTRDKKILFFHSEIKELNEKHFSHLREIKNIDYDAISAAINTVFNTGEPFVLDYDYKKVRRSMTISPLDKSVFGRECVIWFSHDNTELQEAREQAEYFARKSAASLQQLRENTRMWKILLNALPIIVFAKDPQDDFRYIFANKAARKFANSHVVGLTDFDIFPEKFAREHRREDIENMATPDEGMEQCITFTDNSGKTRYMRDIRYPFTDENGKSLLLGAMFDISEMYKSNPQLPAKPVAIHPTQNIGNREPPPADFSEETQSDTEKKD